MRNHRMADEVWLFFTYVSFLVFLWISVYVKIRVQKSSKYKHNLMKRLGLFVVQIAMKSDLDPLTVLPAEFKI